MSDKSPCHNNYLSSHNYGHYDLLFADSMIFFLYHLFGILKDLG